MRVVDAEHPSIGYSSETVLVDLAWVGPAATAEQTHEFVVRLAPPTVGTFRDYDLGQQTIAQLAAAAAGVAIASPELVTDPQWLGVPFIVMPRVRGHIVGEVAAFDPWLLSLAESRARAGARGVRRRRSRRRIAPTSAAAAGVPERDNEAELDFWADYLDWSSGGAPVPALVDALEWCRAHRPAVESDPVLLWGDVRFGNVIFGDDLAPLAVLDWDMASIGAPEHDVAWFTTLESTTRTLLGQHLDGFPRPRRHDRAVRVAQRAHAARRRVVRDLALVRSTAIMTRIGYLHRDAGLPSPLPIDDNPLLDLLAARIAAPGADP